jgi:hypothetical protein
MKLRAIILILITNNLFAQNPIFTKTKYTEGRISFADFSKINATNLSIEKDSVFFFDLGDSQQKVTSMSNINYLRLREGNQTGKIALIVGGASALLVIGAILNVTSNNAQLRPDVGKISLLIIGGGTLLGALIGSATPKWKTYYIGNEKSSSFKIEPNINIINKNFGIALKLKI